MSRVVALVAVLSLSACSYTFQSKPTRTPSSSPVAANGCSTSPALPIFDTLGAVAGAGAAVYGLTDPDHKEARSAIGFIALVPMLVYTASAVEGYRAAGSCEDLRFASQPSPQTASR